MVNHMHAGTAELTPMNDTCQNATGLEAYSAGPAHYKVKYISFYFNSNLQKQRATSSYPANSAYIIIMSRVLYGSSNVYRNFSRSTIGKDLNLTLVECTRKAVFDAHLGTLGPLKAGSLLVTSVLENFVSDVCLGLQVEQVELFANQQITAHVESLATIVQGSPSSLVMISPLLLRSSPGEFFVRKSKEQKS
jgi:hypothetical protein